MFCQVLKTNGDLCLGTSACFLVPFTHIVVCVKGQEPPSRELIKLELWVNTRQSAELWQKDSHSLSVERFFFPHSKSILASGLPLIEQGSPTVSLLWLLEQITGPEKVASSILNKTTQDLQSVNPWKALRFHSLTCLINMEIVKMF